MERIVTTWQENGMQYTITAKPINSNTAVSTGPPNEMISIFEYLGGKTPEKGTGDKVYKHAKKVGAKIETKDVSTTKYTGKIMLYERSFLDVYFNNNTYNTPVLTKEPIIEYDANNDDLPF